MTAFLDLHRPGDPLLLPNPWDAGSGAHPRLARVPRPRHHQLRVRGHASAAATVSVTRDEALAHAAAIVAATDLPVTADLENGFADDPDGVAETVRLAADDRPRRLLDRGRHGGDDPIYPIELAAERVAAAVEAAGPDLVVTARAENHLHGRDDLADTIARLQRYQEAGAHVLYAPGLTDPDDIATADRSGRPAGQRAGASAGRRRSPSSRGLGVSPASRSAARSPSPPTAPSSTAATELRDAGTYHYLDTVRATRGMSTAAWRAEPHPSQLQVGAHHDRAVDRAGGNWRPGWPRCGPGR